MITSYYRPETVEEALQLLGRRDVKTVVLPGQLLSDARIDETTEAVVDLQAVGFDQLEMFPAGLRIGGLTRLQTIVDSALAVGLLREAAHQEAPSTFRHMQTIGSIMLKADAESRLLAALLALDARLTIQTLSSVSEVGLADFLADGETGLNSGIITAVTVANDGRTATAHVGRTPADKPIVAAVARRVADGEIRLALAGVARTPILIAASDIEQLEPPGDFRGSSAYRKQMAMVLSQRVLSEVGWTS